MSPNPLLQQHHLLRLPESRSVEPVEAATTAARDRHADVVDDEAVGGDRVVVVLLELHDERRSQRESGGRRERVEVEALEAPGVVGEAGGYSQTEARLRLNLAGQTQVALSFWR